MGNRRVVIRIVGMASTAKGFAYVVTEEPGRRIVEAGGHKTAASEAALAKVMVPILGRSRPLFVAIERHGGPRKRSRGGLFAKAVEQACNVYRIMILPVEASEIQMLAEGLSPTKWNLAKAMTERYPDLAPKLPKPRNKWRSESEGMGVFMAAAAAAAGWNRFGRKTERSP